MLSLRRLFLAFTPFVLVSILTSCNFYKEKPEAGNPTLASGQTLTSVSWDRVRQQVFVPYCISCHNGSGGVDFSSYESVKTRLDEIRRTVLVQKTMPKDRPLPSSETSLLSAWISAGAPEFESGEGNRVDPVPSPLPTSVPPASITYATVREQVFAPKCIACHGSAGGVNLESYSSTKLWLSSIERTTFVDKTMPKSGVLTSEQAALLFSWIRAGAPEGSPGNDIPAEPLKPEFASIRKRILEPKCLTCHSTGGSAFGVPLDTLRLILDSPRELVIPGNPDESGLLISVTRADSRRMPPPNVSPSLSSDEITVLRRWIELGAPESDGVSLRPIREDGLTFKTVFEAVFKPRCVTCHGSAGGVNLESYDSILSNLSAIERAAIIDRSMPPRSSLSGSETDLLSAWIRVGAPMTPGTPGSTPGGKPGSGKSPIDPTQLSYGLIKERIFTPRCISCHGNSGGVNLESYASVKSNLAKVAIAVLADKTMPPRILLSQEDSKLLARWIKAGAPENPGATQPEEPLRPTFSSIKKKVFEPKCMSCHSPGGNASGVPLQTLKELIDSPRELVIPGNSEESGLTLAILRPDSDPRRMPPPSVGAARLSEQEIEVIRKWIDDGVKE